MLLVLSFDKLYSITSKDISPDYHFHIERKNDKYFAHWMYEYSKTDTMVLSDMNGEFVPVKIPMSRKRKSHIYKKEISTKIFRSNVMKKFILQRSNRPGPSYGVGYNFMIDSLFIENDQQNFILPSTDLGSLNEIDTGDTLTIIFDGNNYDRKFIIDIKNGLKSSKTFNKQFHFIKSQNNKLYYLAKQRSKKIKIPSLSWKKNNGKPVFIEYRIRMARSNQNKYINDWLNSKWYKKLWLFGKNKDKHNILIQNSSKVMVLSYGNLTFKIDKHFRYDFSSSKTKLTAPPLVIEQAGSNIIREGDRVELRCVETIPIEWVDYINKNSGFTVDVTSDKVIFTKNKGNISNRYLLPELQFRVTEKRSFSIELFVDFFSDHSEWEKKNYTVNLHSDGLDVGHL